MDGRARRRRFGRLRSRGGLAAVAAVSALAGAASAAAVITDGGSGLTLSGERGRCRLSAKLVPECGALWGMYSTKGSNLTTAITDIEGRVGRRFDVVLRFHDFSNAPGPGRFPDDSEVELGKDRLLFFAWESRRYATRQAHKWKDIAAGRYDDEVVRPVAERVRAYGKTVFMSFDPEMDRHTNDLRDGERKGTEAEYVAAARHVHRVFKDAGVRNVVWVWVTTGSLGGGNEQRMLRAYPGDEYVDWVGWDPYNFYKCKNSPWNTFEQEVAPTYRWLQRNKLDRKPFILPEYGTQFDPQDPGRSKQWYRDIPGVLKRYPNLKGLIRFDAGPGCNLKVDNGPGMMEAYREAGRHPHLNARSQR